MNSKTRTRQNKKKLQDDGVGPRKKMVTRSERVISNHLVRRMCGNSSCRRVLPNKAEHFAASAEKAGKIRGDSTWCRYCTGKTVTIKAKPSPSW